jgi:hypothetical protein
MPSALSCQSVAIIQSNDWLRGWHLFKQGLETILDQC